MRIFTDTSHALHNPPHQFNVDHLGPYSECPERVDRILDAVRDHHDIRKPTHDAADVLARVHSGDYLHFIEHVYAAWSERGGTPDGLIPYTFASRGLTTIPDDLVNAAGYYGFDPQTPIVAGTYRAAKASADCAVSAAEAVRGGGVSYALCRPPGHHAGRDLYGGYCFFNNAMIAAEQLGGRGAILDIDYHHGNGTQSIVYDREDILFVSLHADPNRQYPFFSGSREETGRGAGLGKTVNIPLPANIDDAGYLEALRPALDAIAGHTPDYLIVSAGFDIYADDPLGDFAITFDGIQAIGAAIAELGLPTVIVQEGGYNTGALGTCAARFLAAFETD